MDQLLTEAARDRLNNIRLVKAEKAERLETIIIANAQGGRFSGKVTDEQLLDLMD